MTTILKYQLLLTRFNRDYPNATELDQISACIEFAEACNLYRVESELQKQYDLLRDEQDRCELAEIKK